MANLELDEAERQRFWSYIDDDAECWLWLGPISKEGYGRFNVARADVTGRPRKEALAAHRVSWRIFNGEPDGVVQATCGVPRCVRPEHLRLTPGRRPAPVDGRPTLPPVTVRERVCETCGDALERVAGRWPRLCSSCTTAQRLKPAPRPRLLDLYCGGGGAGEGYRQAGFEVVGVDLIQRACGYPAGTFLQADVLEVLEDVGFLRSFDLIHASPPCQAHSTARHLSAGGEWRVDLIAPTRDGLERAGVPYIIENVPGAPLRADVVVCGSTFPELHTYDETGRRWLRRHRLFETTLALTAPACQHDGAGVRSIGVYGMLGDDIPGGGQTPRDLAAAQELMGAPWMSWAALVEAIPPAYTRLLGGQARRLLPERALREHSLTSA